MKIAGKITISRPQFGDRRKAISLEVTDENSGIRFLDIEISYDCFTEAVTGLGFRPIKMEVRGLENVGKIRVSEPREAVAPDLGYGKETYEAWLKANCQEEGWILDTYLGSQGSVSSQGDGRLLRYRVTKFVDPSEP